MQTKNIYSTSNYLSSRQLKLFNFGIPEPKIPILYQLSDIEDMDLTGNMTFDFVMVSYNYAKLILPKYSSRYSKKTFTQPQLYALLSYKIYNKFTYRRTMENLEFSDILCKALDLKTIPHWTTLQKFYDKLSTDDLRSIDKLILEHFPVEDCMIVMDGTGYTNSYSDPYYNNRTKKKRRKYVKNHITIDSKYKLIRHFDAKMGARHDTIFAIAAIRAIRACKPKYILADLAYDTEPIKRTIIEETTAIPQIPTKKRQKNGLYRTKCRAILWGDVYGYRNYVECVNSIQKRIFSGINTSRIPELQIKETKMKDVFYDVYRSIWILHQEMIST